MMWKGVFAVGKYTAIESFRDRVFYVLFACFLLAVPLSKFITEMVVVEKKMAFASSLSAILYFISAFIPLVLVPVLVNRETVGNVVLVVRSKPVKAWEYLLGKLSGFLIVIAFVVCLIFVILTAFKAGNLTGRVLYCLGMFMEHAITTCSALLFSVGSTSLVSSILLTGMFFFVAHSTYEFAKMAVIVDKPLLTVCVKVLYYVFPSYDFYDFSRTLVYGDSPIVRLPFLVGYTVLYCVLLFVLAKIRFERKEF